MTMPPVNDLGKIYVYSKINKEKTLAKHNGLRSRVARAADHNNDVISS